MKIRDRFHTWAMHSSLVAGCAGLIWFLLRTGTRPTRIVYPCQRAAVMTGIACLAGTLVAVPRVMTARQILIHARPLPILAAAALIATIGGGLYILAVSGVPGVLSPGQVPSAPPAAVPGGNARAEIFVINGTSGEDGGIAALIGLMGSHGHPFYLSGTVSPHSGPGGYISSGDVVVIKINSQWEERGGTNTDLLKELIGAILDHPDGFNGEIIVADNGQGRGSLGWSKANARIHGQSAQDVIGSFGSRGNVSGYLWDTVRTTIVSEYRNGDLRDGYVVNTTSHALTGLMVTYPKFRTSFGTYVSLKEGIWDPGSGAYASDRLKLINMPVLKTHAGFGVTGALKHYMGVLSTSATTTAGGAHPHDTIGKGGMGTEMAESRYPALTIIDAVWVNPHPGRGPPTSYADATFTGMLVAGTDPVALDLWASRAILMPAARSAGHADLSSIDPGNTGPGSFGAWLRATAAVLQSYGYPVVTGENQIDLYRIDRPVTPPVSDTRPPTASFSVRPRSGTVPLTVQVTDRSRAARTWQWDFSGGFPDPIAPTGPGPYHVRFDTPGRYRITLHTGNDLGTDHASQAVSVKLPKRPRARLHAEPRSGSGLTTVTFTDRSRRSLPLTTRYDLDPGDGSPHLTGIGPMAPVIHRYARGRYTPVLTLTDPYGQVARGTVRIRVA